MATEVIKVYLPKNSSGNFLYGHKREEIGKNNNEKNKTNKTKLITCYYVIRCAKDKLKTTSLELLGSLGKSTSAGLSLLKDDSGTITEVHLNGSKLPLDHRVILFNYDKEKFLQSYNENYSELAIENHFALFIAQTLKADQEHETGKTFIHEASNKLHNCLVAFATIASKILRFIAPLFHNTVIYRHCSNWRKCLNDENSKNGFFVLDILLGVLLFMLMNHVQHSGRYFMDLTELIVNKLRGLLEMLEGSPVGLKLNVQFNNFLLSCFMYHVDLWWNFIVIIEPAIHYLFLPITTIGFMGFSFQCALLCDVITLITLHAHCFYIYAAMLYKLELSSIRSLLRIVLGRRLNVLKSNFMLRI